jgi:hypothetical protein
MTIDLKNLQSNSNNYKVISFPKRIKITEMSFSVNGEAAGAPELDRVWKLYVWGAHPTPTEGSPWSEWSFPVFNSEEKPVLNNETRNFYSTIESPESGLVSLPSGGGILKLEFHQGVFAPNDYMAIWVQNDGGDVSEITWEDTEATINIVYEETVMKTLYELVQANPWLD